MTIACVRVWMLPFLSMRNSDVGVGTAMHNCACAIRISIWMVVFVSANQLKTALLTILRFLQDSVWLVHLGVSATPQAVPPATNPV